MMQIETLFEEVDGIMDKYGREQCNLIPILTDTQGLVEHNYIPEEVIEYVACGLGLATSRVYEVVTFYDALSDVPRGKHIVQVCDSTVCRLNKNTHLVDFLERMLNVKMGNTRQDGIVTLEYTPCFGACDISPAIRIDKQVYGKLTEEKLTRLLNEKIGGESW